MLLSLLLTDLFRELTRGFDSPLSRHSATRDDGFTRSCLRS
jgi:hypothetical protein